MKTHLSWDEKEKAIRLCKENWDLKHIAIHLDIEFYFLKKLAIREGWQYIDFEKIKQENERKRMIEAKEIYRDK